MIENRKSLATLLRENASLLILVIALIAVRWTFVEPYVVPTGSMEPTLKTGDRLYALKCAYDVRFPFTDWVLFKVKPVKRGDVILFRNPRDPSITFVKRALAVEGDTVEMRNGDVFVNGDEVRKDVQTDRGLLYDIDRQEDKSLFIEHLGPVNHWVILDNTYYMKSSRSFPAITIPADHVFAVGDNRDNSYDSRAWGFVPMQNLKGQAMFIWFSSWNWRIRPERIGTWIQ